MKGGRRHWRELFPVPYVAAATLLGVLVLLTPNLISFGSPAAGSLETQAYLVIDRAMGDNVTHVYLRSLGNARYTAITLELATNAHWPAPDHLSGVGWNRTVNETDVLVATLATAADPFVANVSATYVDPAGVTEQYIGEFEFHFAGGALDVATFTPGLASVSPTPENALPIYLPLLALPLR